MDLPEEDRRSRLIHLVYRLEAATSRLEDIASSSQSLTHEKPAHGTSVAAVSRAASMNGDLGTPVAPSATAAPSIASATELDLPRQIEDFDQMIREDATPLQALSARIGGSIAESVRTMSKLYISKGRPLNI